MNIMKMKSKIVLSVLIITILISCSSNLKVIQTEYKLQKFENENINLEKLGNGKVLIYNGADALHQATGRINIWIDGKPLGQLRLKEYLIVNLDEGSYNFKLQHIDLVNMRSKHDVEITKKTKIIRVEPTAFSNKLTVTNDVVQDSGNLINMTNR